MGTVIFQLIEHGVQKKAEKGKVGKHFKSDWEGIKSQAKGSGLLL